MFELFNFAMIFIIGIIIGMFILSFCGMKKDNENNEKTDEIEIDPAIIASKNYIQRCKEMQMDRREDIIKAINTIREYLSFCSSEGEDQYRDGMIQTLLWMERSIINKDPIKANIIETLKKFVNNYDD